MNSVPLTLVGCVEFVRLFSRTYSGRPVAGQGTEGVQENLQVEGVSRYFARARDILRSVQVIVTFDRGANFFPLPHPLCYAPVLWYYDCSQYRFRGNTRPLGGHPHVHTPSELHELEECKTHKSKKEVEYIP